MNRTFNTKSEGPVSKGWQLMISDVQKALISDWNQIDIRLLDLVETWLFSAIFQIFILWPLSSDIWLIFRYVYPADIFWYSVEVRQIFNWNLVNFLMISVYFTSDIQLISLISLYPVHRFPARYDSPCPFPNDLVNAFLERLFHSNS